MTVSIPANTTATVVLPAADPADSDRERQADRQGRGREVARQLRRRVAVRDRRRRVSLRDAVDEVATMAKRKSVAECDGSRSSRRAIDVAVQARMIASTTASFCMSIATSML